MVVNLKKAIIVDLDGTFIDDSATKHMHFQENPDWDSVAGKTLEHPHNEWCKTLIEGAVKQGLHIIFLTGRSEKHRVITQQWLDMHIPECLYSTGYAFLMRPALDERDDVLVKTDIYYQQVLPFYSIVFAVDDKKSVIDMWRNLCIPALHCSDFHI